jgi:hypothetical protein
VLEIAHAETPQGKDLAIVQPHHRGRIKFLVGGRCWDRIVVDCGITIASHAVQRHTSGTSCATQACSQEDEADRDSSRIMATDLLIDTNISYHSEKSGRTRKVFVFFFRACGWECSKPPLPPAAGTTLQSSTDRRAVRAIVLLCFPCRHGRAWLIVNTTTSNHIAFLRRNGAGGSDRCIACLPPWRDAAWLDNNRHAKVVMRTTGCGIIVIPIRTTMMMIDNRSRAQDGFGGREGSSGGGNGD